MSSNDGSSDRRLTITGTKWTLKVTGFPISYKLRDFMAKVEEFYKEFRFQPTWTKDHFVIVYQKSDEIVGETFFDVTFRTKQAAEWYQMKFDGLKLMPDGKSIGRHVYLRGIVEEVGHFCEPKPKQEDREGGNEPEGGMFKLELD